MRGKIVYITGVVLILACLGGCFFKPQPFKGVISYRNGKVFIRQKKYYRVGQLPDNWHRFKSHARTISFYNRELKASISTDAYCGKTVGDRTLASLSGEVITAMESRHIETETDFMLGGRGALRQQITGKVDGVPANVDLVIVRKNNCVFDFYSVVPADVATDVKADFETFFNGFHYE